MKNWSKYVQYLLNKKKDLVDRYRRLGQIGLPIQASSSTNKVPGERRMFSSYYMDKACEKYEKENGIHLDDEMYKIQKQIEKFDWLISFARNKRDQSYP